MWAVQHSETGNYLAIIVEDDDGSLVPMWIADEAQAKRFEHEVAAGWQDWLDASGIETELVHMGT